MLLSLLNKNLNEMLDARISPGETQAEKRSAVVRMGRRGGN